MLEKRLDGWKEPKNSQNGKKAKKKMIKKTVAKRPKLRKSGAWSFMLKIWCHRQISNFGDGISFGH